MAKSVAKSSQKKPGGLSDKVSDIVLVVICAAVMLIVAYPLYYVLMASFSDPYDVYAGKTFLLPSQFTLKGYQAVFADSALFSGFINSMLPASGSPSPTRNLRLSTTRARAS